MSRLTTIASGVLLLLLAASGLIYVMARQAPPLEDLEPQQLAFEEPQPSPVPKPTASPKSQPPTISYRTVRAPRPRQPKPIKTFSVELISPSMAETFVAPANIVLKASANHEPELKGIEFYRSPEATVCRSLTKLMRLPEELKLGEALSAPYELRWNTPQPGTHTIMAVATYAGGEQQVSSPVVIIVTGPNRNERPAAVPSPEPYRMFPDDWERMRSSQNRTCPFVVGPIHYITTLRTDRKGVNRCSENPIDPANTPMRLGIYSHVADGTYSNLPTFQYWTNGGKIINDGPRSIWSLAGVKPGVYTIIAKSDDGCDCSNVNTQAVVVTNSCTPVSSGVGGDPVDPPENVGGGTDPTVDEPPPDTITLPSTARPAERLVGAGVAQETDNAGTREVEISQPTETQPDSAPDKPHGRPRTKEKEWIKISWTPRVKSDDSVTVKIVYDRTTDSFKVSDTAGEVSEELKLGKLLKEWFGKDYQVFGDVRLRTAGLKCDSCNQEQYQSFDKERLEWSWPLKPEGTGKQSFNVELWVKGEPRDRSSEKPSIAPEKVWSRTDNKVEVTNPFLTRNTVYTGGGLCAVLGFGLCVRGMKIYRIGDTYNVGQAVAVGRNVTMTNTTVNQQAETNDMQNGEERDA